MKKIILIMALMMMYSLQANAADRDCAKYTATQASSVTSEGASNTVGIIFSGKTSRKGLTNSDCVQTSGNTTTDTGSTNDTGGSTSSGGSSGGGHSGGGHRPTPH